MSETDAPVSSERPKLSEVIVVEGLHDKQAVDRAVHADVFVLGGDRTSHRIISEIKRAARVRGVVVLTDPDGPGERIRRRLDGEIAHCSHAYIKKSEATLGGRVGVEFADPSVIKKAIEDALLRNHGDSVSTSSTMTPSAEAFCLEDLLSAGLVGTKDAMKRREVIGERIGIGYANAKAFVKKLNALRVTRDEWREALLWLAKDEERGD